MLSEYGDINLSLEEIESSFNASMLSEKKKIATASLRSSSGSSRNFSFLMSQSKNVKQL